MKITKIRIKNLFGIKECELDGKSVEITGTNGAGKSSVIDAIRYALKNDSDRDLIIRDGEDQGEILIETDTGLTINRMKRKNQADYKSVKEGKYAVTSPESFLKTIFTELQINPVAFIEMPKKDQNRTILDLIEFKWDLNWIREQFGEIPEGVNYDQNILQVLNDIQAENGDYFRHRQDINRDIRNKEAFIEEIAQTIPKHYDADKWEHFDVSGAYKRLNEAQHNNNLIERAKAFKSSYDGKMRGLSADRDLAISVHRKFIEKERTNLTAEIARLEAEIKAANDKIGSLDGILEDKIEIENQKYEAAVAQLNKDIGTAEEYIDKELIDTAPIQEEIDGAEKMKAHLNEYRRMMSLAEDVEQLGEASKELTRKIELARTLPGKILETATIPVDGLTVKDGIPLINGMPISNLSDGEKLDLCVDVAISKPAGLQIILIDGIERLSDVNRKRLYDKCKAKGIQFIATRTTDDAEMQVTAL